ncbi:hypothetical protein HZB74_00005 [Candidatus Saccharibacteria bacterium]|nr:hypothetical protein [Candidatus Saccharibacteria bacterium]
MSFGEVGDDAPYDRLLVIGDDAEIQRKFIEILGFQWRDFIVQGHVKDNEEQVV